MATKSIWLSLVAVFFCVHGYRAKTEQTSKPNIVVIVADDLGWDDVSFHGSRQIPTPNIDALAFGGIILNNYYVSPICTPSRSALMTGRHPIHTGLQHSVIVGSEPYGLGLNETIMPQYFKQLGYATRMVGKWHLGFFAKEYTPLYRGFDSHFGYWLGAEDYFSHNAWATKDENGLDFRRDMEVYNDSGKYSTEEFTKEAVSVIENHDTSKPLFLYLAHQAVHSANPGDPIQAPQKYIDRFGYIKNEHRRKFAGVVSALDDSIGNLTLALYDKGILNNTIIVFTTDNGGPAAGFDMNYASNWPLKGVKATIWEGGVRGVGFAWSQLFNPDARERVSKDMIHICDWLPTLYRAAGGDPTTLKNSDGMDVWDTLSKSKPSPRTEILHNIDPVVGQGAIRVGDMKLVVGVGPYHGDWDHWYAPEEYHAKKHHGKLNHYLDNEMKYEIIEGNKVPIGFKKTKPISFEKIKWKSRFRRP